MKMGSPSMGGSKRRVSSRGLGGALREQRARLYIIRRVYFTIIMFSSLAFFLFLSLLHRFARIMLLSSKIWKPEENLLTRWVFLDCWEYSREIRVHPNQDYWFYTYKTKI
ncbi:hypothetical protein CR513_51382, partial [Mucuna pruriens]